MRHPARVAMAMWADLEKRIRLAEPRLADRLPRGATDRALERAEARLGSRLPPIAREIYRIHDGIGMPAYVKSGQYMCATSSYFLSLADALKEWRSWTRARADGLFDDLRIDETEGPVRAQWWNPLWLPISANGAGDYECLDLDPAPGGTIGQVIYVWHDMASRSVSAPDLATFLLGYVDEDEWAASFQQELARKATPRRQRTPARPRRKSRARH